MTGDRMINLARTPANVDFQSKYYRPVGGAAARGLAGQFGQTGESAANQRQEGVRGSRSEDQLAQEAEQPASEEEAGSCHALARDGEVGSNNCIYIVVFSCAVTLHDIMFFCFFWSHPVHIRTHKSTYGFTN